MISGGFVMAMLRDLNNNKYFIEQLNGSFGVDVSDEENEEDEMNF